MATYRITAGLPGEQCATPIDVNHNLEPLGFSSFQTHYEYDTAGNVTRTITEGLPSGRRAYDSYGNVIYEEDATGVATAYTYDVLGRLRKSEIVDPKTRVHIHFRPPVHRFRS